MKKIAIIVLLQMAAPLYCSEKSGGNFVSVSFVVDGKPAECNDSALRLLFHGQVIVPEFSNDRFRVPAVFETDPSDWPENDKVKIHFTCGSHVLDFEEHPSWVTAGYWTFAIEYPPHWIDLAYTHAIEHGMWISSLTSECNDCDPGVVSSITHSDLPRSIADELIHEQPTASGGHARDIAYGLAVFKINYEQNRDYLVRLLNTCLSRPKESSEDDICDGTLLDYVTNLYWRGDSELIGPLMKIADSRKDVLLEIGIFYSDLLDRRAAAILHGMQNLTIERQRTICQLVGSELRRKTPQYERVLEHLRSDGSEVAGRCMREIRADAGNESDARISDQR